MVIVILPTVSFSSPFQTCAVVCQPALMKCFNGALQHPRKFETGCVLTASAVSVTATRPTCRVEIRCGNAPRPARLIHSTSASSTRLSALRLWFSKDRFSSPHASVPESPRENSLADPARILRAVHSCRLRGFVARTTKTLSPFAHLQLLCLGASFFRW